MATQLQPNPRLEPAIETLLAGLRRRIRAYVWADGLAAIGILLGAAFWVSLSLDWLIEPPRPLRLVLLVGFGMGLGYVAYRWLISRLLVPLHDRSMAVLLERRFGEFGDSLLTTVELSQQPDHASDFHPEMLARAHRQALRGAEQVNLTKVFNTTPLARRVTLAIALLAAVAVFAIAAPSALGTWARRTLLLSNELWPRRTHLSVAGFDNAPRVKIARGSDWNLVVHADAGLGREVPDVIEVRYSTTEGVRGRENMSRDGVVTPGEEQVQPYAYAFKSVLAPLEFYVAGGDDREGPFYLDVVDSPTLSGMTLRCEFPAYTGRAPRDLPVAGLMQVPRGTQITILATANKPLVDVQIDDIADENAPVTHRVDVAQQAGGNPQDKFQFKVGRLDSDKTLLFTLRDADGIRSREAVRLSLAAIPDEPPQVNVLLKGVGAAITPAARLPALGDVSDDYGVTKLWFDFHVDDAVPQQRPLEVQANGQVQLPVSGVMELAELKLVPKQRLHWAVQAADNAALDKGSNVGTSQRYALDVVTPEQLRSILEARELTLRRRFETMIEEFADTRDLLAGIEARPAPAAADQPAATKPGAVASEPAAPHPLSPAVQVERVVQNSERSMHEVAELGVSFEEICEELVNNRIDTVELKTRLQDGISLPLKAIAADRFPPLLEKLKTLAGQLGKPSAAVATQSDALAQTDAILAEMRGVLDKMLELETFNEALDMLRQIIDSQQKVNDETKEQQKKDLRSLIE
jgi:hypothetical protein